jgi:hypothetical protein
MAQINNTLREIAVREIARMRATLAGCDAQAAEQVAHYAVTAYAREGSAYRALERAKVYARQRARQHVEGVEVDESPAVEEITLWTDPHLDADWGPTKEAVDLAERVRDEVQPWHSVAYKQGLSLDLVDHIISSAFAQIARDVRQGRSAVVEYIGLFEQIPGGGVRFVADPELLQPWPTNIVALRSREEAA